MPSSFNVESADGYEQLMGRWSKKLAPGLVDFAGLADGESILDVGCAREASPSRWRKIPA